MKPALAEDCIRNLIQYLNWAQAKVDGVRALNLTGRLTGRSLKEFKGTGISDFWSHGLLRGFDGEMILGDDPTSPNRLCSLTTGAMGAFKGVSEMPDLHWFIFDIVHESTVKMTYAERYELMQERLEDIKAHLPQCAARMHVVPYELLHSEEQLDEVIGKHLDAGYEGTILRNPRSVYKEGRSTQEGQLWRIKPWGDFEILVTGVTEGAKNTNEAKTNELGRTERSSAQDGLVPNGQIGSVQGTLMADVFDHSNRLLFRKGTSITAGSGEMTVEEAAAWFADQTQIVGQIARIKHMTHGVKTLPRFPTYQTKRLREDMSN